MNHIKSKNLCSATDAAKRRKTKATDWEKIATNPPSKAQYLECIKNSQNSTIRKQTKDMKRHCSADGQTANKHTKRG